MAWGDTGGFLISGGGDVAGYRTQGGGPGSPIQSQTVVYNKPQGGGYSMPRYSAPATATAPAPAPERPQFSPLMKAIGGASSFSNITQGPVWTQNQIDQRVNQMRGSNTARTQSDIGAMQRNMAGRGFGSNSPAAQEMASNRQAQNMMASTQGENDLRWGAAKDNANMVTQREGLRLGREQAVSDADIARRKVQQIGVAKVPGTYTPNGSALSQALFNQRPQEQLFAANMGWNGTGIS